jgi:hypothetical protein
MNKSMILIQHKSRLLVSFVGFLLTIVILLFAPSVWAAAGVLSVSPSTNLVNGQNIDVSGSGLAVKSIGSILECNNDPNQPTIQVAGSPVPVSCTNPLLKIVNTTSSGTLPATTFIVHSGIVGPPANGTDSSGISSSISAALYPCPPTAAQIAAGYTCGITFGDANGDDLVENITFANQSTATTTPSSTPQSTITTPQPATTKTQTQNSTNSAQPANSSALVNTGPGNIVVPFVLSVIAASAAYYGYLMYRKKTY